MDYEEVELAANQEYRIEVSAGKRLRVMATAGIAEVRGQELLGDKWYIFTNICASISTFTGAKLRIDGTCELRYVSRSTMSAGVFNYFDRLRSMGGRGEEKKIERIMVVGAGRTTFCTTLANYFLRMHQKVTFTEIDPSKGNIFPGAIGSTLVEAIVDYAEGFKLNNPQCLFYGSTEIENVELFDLQINALQSAIRGREQFFQMVLAPMVEPTMLNNLIKRGMSGCTIEPSSSSARCLWRTMAT